MSARPRLLSLAVAAGLAVVVAKLHADTSERIYASEITSTPVSKMAIVSNFRAPIGSVTVVAELNNDRSRFKSLEISLGNRVRVAVAGSLLACFSNPDIRSLNFNHAAYERVSDERPNDWYKGWWTAVSFDSYPNEMEQLVTIVMIDGKVKRAEIMTKDNKTTILEADRRCAAQ